MRADYDVRLRQTAELIIPRKCEHDEARGVGMTCLDGVPGRKDFADIPTETNGTDTRQPGTVADGKYPVASSGRVYCYCDADAGGSIKPGDLLTTSNTPGHAMKVKNYPKARGAIIGKAMSSLNEGTGLVLVLVTLQ